MRAHKLLRDLKSFLDEVLADFELPGPTIESMARARVYFGNVPDDNSGLDERFPFVIIRWSEGEDGEEGQSEEEAALIFGVFSPSGPGEAELITAALMDHVRSALMEKRILGQTFDLLLPLKSAKPDPEKRQHNYHIAAIITRWNHQVVRRDLNKGDFDD